MNNKAFTLVELTITSAILAFVISGMLLHFIKSSYLTDLAGNKTLAHIEAQDKIEEIRNFDYDLIATNYDNTSFTFLNPSGTGIIDINSDNAELLVVNIAVSWENQDKRISGQDTNLNGVIDGGETNTPINLMSMITRR